MSDTGYAIEVNALTMEFSGVVAVDHLSFDVKPGEIFGLVGPDGAGKTTTMRMLAGVLTPSSGTAAIAGFDVVRDPQRVKHHISYMSQRFGLYEDLTVNENIRFYAGIFGLSKTDRERRALTLLDAAGMSPFGKRLAGKLSGGMKQKLGLICALIHTPQVIILDEPTNGVDPVSRRDFWRILYSLLGENVAILISTSYLDEAERCHRVALLHQGRLLYSDTPAELKKKISGDVVLVISPEPRRLRDLLKDSEGVSNLVLVGDGLRLIVDDAKRRVPELRGRIESENLPVDRIEEVTPTVEDLFVQAVEKASVRAASG
ncbi:MAG TPA: ABC transporter ATP-binding protein [Syntrophorhabdales bacterium]|nr:ABC transporter ATP-binding protein [Syntrophorhabdales bacterium]